MDERVPPTVEEIPKEERLRVLIRQLEQLAHEWDESSFSTKIYRALEALKDGHAH